MNIVTRELWPGHRMVLIVVRQWRPIYRHFNRVFARASRRREYAITERDSDMYKAVAYQRHV